MTTTAPTLLSKTAAAYLPFNKHTFTPLSAIAGTLLALTAITLPVAYRDYRKFLSYGPGGVPHNVFGWVVVNLMRPLTRETLSTTVYEEKMQQGKTESFLANLPAREGERPEMGSHAVPQRQMNQIPDLEVKEVCIHSTPNEIFESYSTLSSNMMLETHPEIHGVRLEKSPSHQNQ